MLKGIRNMRKLYKKFEELDEFIQKKITFFCESWKNLYDNNGIIINNNEEDN